MADLISMLAAAAGTSAGGGEYQISRSLRFNSADSAYLSRTFSAPTAGTKWTWSSWVKRSALYATKNEQTLFGTQGAGAQGAITFSDSSDFIQFKYSGAFRRSGPVSFRDVSAWYHIVVSIDTTDATESNRAKLYVNGIQQTWTTSTSITQNDTTQINQNVVHNIGSNSGASSSEYSNIYLAETYFIDGSALTPSSFGETNETTGVWSPIAYAGSYGTNGFYLNFSDNTSTTTLGEDQAGSNDWTLNNLATSDSMLDTPSNNFAVMNPLSTTQPFTFLEGNLRVYGSTSIDDAMVQATIGMRTGKWYWETLYTDSSNTGARAGISADNTYDAALYYVGETTKSYGINFVDGNKFNNASNSSYGSAFTQNSILMTAYDADNGKLWWGIDGIWYASGDPATGTNAAFTSIPENDYFPTISDSSLSNDADSFWLNFGQDSTFAGNKPIGIATDSSGVANFQYTPPSGFKALVTTNLPEPTVVQGDDYFNTVLYEGTGSSLGVTGVGFQPDWVWIKERSGAADHGLYDAVRGVTKQLESNTQSDETTEATGLTAFGTDGFTVGALAQLNTIADTYVAWNWKADGAGVSNGDGTITSTVSANTTAKISIVTYTGNVTAGATVGHGLGVAPKMIILKARTTGPTNWFVYHASVGNTEALFLNLTNASFASSTYWNDTSPTSSVFSLGTNVATNGGTLVAYCFAEVEGFSKFGSYTGNGLPDGPFVYTGFRPAFVMVKSSSAGGNWLMQNNKTLGYNPSNSELYANLPNDETTADRADLLSNGFKPRINSAENNGSGVTYIYMAFAENPFKYSLAR
jgi:hypothetical protein